MSKYCRYNIVGCDLDIDSFEFFWWRTKYSRNKTFQKSRPIDFGFVSKAYYKVINSKMCKKSTLRSNQKQRAELLLIAISMIISWSECKIVEKNGRSNWLYCQHYKDFFRNVREQKYAYTFHQIASQTVCHRRNRWSHMVLTNLFSKLFNSLYKKLLKISHRYVVFLLQSCPSVVQYCVCTSTITRGQTNKRQFFQISVFSAMLPVPPTSAFPIFCSLNQSQKK